MFTIDNYISSALDIVDEDSTVTGYNVDGNVKTVTITKNLRHDLLCPLCGSKLHSRGKFIRHPKNQVLQDGYVLKINAIGRKWECSSETCSYNCRDQFEFIPSRKQVTNIIIIMILIALKDIRLTCRQVAAQFRVSDTFVHQTFLQYVNLKRKPLTEYLCIDEVYLNISPTCKYALVIMDFLTGEPLDIIESRRQSVTEPYFLSIPKEEREKVKFLCCDMYDPYVNYAPKYFPNAVVITDSFHVLQWLLRLIKRYINDVKKRYQERDRKLLQEKNHDSNRDFQTSADSKEVYLLKNGQWVILKNRSGWKYMEARYNRRMDMVMDTYAWEREVLKLDKNFKAIRDLKDLYESFNEQFVNDLDGAADRLDTLIEIYSQSSFQIFREFAALLKSHRETIVNSFVYVKDIKNEDILRRLSNGILESFNNIPSAYRTQSHGVDCFEFSRNRILWHMWDDAKISLVPRTKEEIHREGKKRGPYKK